MVNTELISVRELKTSKIDEIFSIVEQYPSIIDSAFRSTISLRVEKLNTLEGSGIIIMDNGQKYLITANHVILKLEAGQNLFFYYSTNKLFLRKYTITKKDIVYSCDTNNPNYNIGDIAIVRLDREIPLGIELIDRDIEASEPAFNLSFPFKHKSLWELNLRPLITFANVHRVTSDCKTSPIKEFHTNDFTGKSGQSGSGLIDYNGKLICIASSGYIDMVGDKVIESKTIFYGIDKNFLKRFIES